MSVPAATALALTLQIGDSAFPSGAFAYSFGLERLARDGRVDRSTVAAWIEGELCHRWVPFDRIATARAHGSAAAALTTDAQIEASLWSEPARKGSRAAGRGLCAAARRIGLLTDDPIAAALAGNASPGHLAVVEGRIWREIGLDAEQTQIAAGHGFVARLASAAIRLSLLGALGAQTLRARLAPRISALVDPAAADAPLASAAPLGDIALMRHDLPGPGARLFSN
ncbi:MAG: urease accessory protein UreF [Paracoccaceae bacterium]